MSDLKNYFDEHRREFDTEAAPDQTWDRISKTLDARRAGNGRRTTSLRWMRAAAMIALCFAAGFAASQLMQHNASEEQPHALDLSRYSPELVKMDETYSPVIEQTLNEIRYLPEYATDTAKFSIFVDQFRFLQDQNNYYLDALRDHGYDQKIVDELIRNYHYKLDLLEKLKEEIRKFNIKNKSESHEHKANLIAI